MKLKEGDFIDWELQVDGVILILGDELDIANLIAQDSKGSLFIALIFQQQKKKITKLINQTSDLQTKFMGTGILKENHTKLWKYKKLL